MSTIPVPSLDIRGPFETALPGKPNRYPARGRLRTPTVDCPINPEQEKMTKLITSVTCAVLLTACGPSTPEPSSPISTAPAAAESAKDAPGLAEANGVNNLYWGDTHLHTSYSPDAYLMQNRSADPDTAYRYAKGYPVVHPYHKARIQIETPLDFLVVSDHSEFMGVVPMVLQGDPRVANTETGQRYRQMAEEGREIEVFGELIAQVNKIAPPRPRSLQPGHQSVRLGRDHGRCGSPQRAG
jgi:hypothetical protein